MIRAIIFAVACLSLVSFASASVITFENTPAAGTPVDDTPLTTPYNITGGGTVSFYFDVNGNNIQDGGDLPGIFEAAGPDGLEGFANSGLGLNDTAMPGFAGQLGSWFLRQPTPGSVPPPFMIQYVTGQTISALSGEIWDIDGGSPQGGPVVTEQWFVEVLDSTNNLLASQFSPLGNNQSLDGLPWVFTFSGLPLGVDKLRITFVGSKTGGLGLAFNNFGPTTVPEPSGIVLFALGAAGAVFVGIRRKHAAK